MFKAFQNQELNYKKSVQVQNTSASSFS